MTIHLETLTGPDIEAAIPDLSRLRATVFADWPYLYDADPINEAAYLKTFANAQSGIIVAAYDGNTMIGAATAAPLAGHTEEFIPLFEANGYATETVFYCGESVLLSAYRGQGLGHRFFDSREGYARTLNSEGADFHYSAFCGVVRDPADPRRPADYRPLDTFWAKRGYQPITGMIGNYDWQEIDGRPEEIGHPMQFWVKRL